MEFRPPTPQDVETWADRYGFDLAEEQVDAFVESLAGKAAIYDRLAELEVEPELAETSVRRTLSTDPESDPYRAVVARCEVATDTDGPLSGLDIGLKDNIAVAGVPMGLGSPHFADFTPSHDATAVRRLLEAGGRITAKLTTDSNQTIGHTPPALNPRDPAYQPGRSSSGCAAAVVAGDVDLAIGTDQGGSVRWPAAWSGCVGLKPTYGLVPYTGMVGIGLTFDHAGPLARDVPTCARALEAMAGSNGRDPRQHRVHRRRYEVDLSDGRDEPTVGLLDEGFELEDADERVLGVTHRALDQFEAAGAVTTDASVPVHPDASLVHKAVFTEESAAWFLTNQVGRFHQDVYDLDLLSEFGDARRHVPEETPERTKRRVIFGTYLHDEYDGWFYGRAQNARHRIRQAYDEALAAVDVLAMPTIPYPAAEIEPSEAENQWDDIHRNTCPFNQTGHPAISVPCGTVDGLPVGLMFVGEHLDDDVVLSVARDFESSVDWEDVAG